MARKKLVHIHSNVLNKMPKPADLNVGELAVNNNVGNEFISLKNGNDEVVRFSSDDQLVDWMNQKEVFPVSGEVETNLEANTSSLFIANNQYADSATTGADKANEHKGVMVDTSMFALSGGNVVFNTINGNDASSLGNITNITYTPNNEIEEGVSGNTLEFVQSGNNKTTSVNLVFDDDLNSESVNAVQNKVLNNVLEEMEEVTAAALNDLNDRVLELENTPDIHVTGGRFSGGTLYIEQENGETIEIGDISTGEGADGNNYPSSLTLDSNDVLVLGRNGMSNLTVDLSVLNNGDVPNSGRVETGTGAQSGSTFINFYNGTTKLFSVNADDLMVDGMVESVSIGQAVPEGETEAVPCLIVDWNTAAGDKTTNIPLTSIFNPDNYYTKQDIQNNYYTKQDVYTKQEINNALGSDFEPSSVTSSVTEVINGLEDRIGELEGKEDKYLSSGSFNSGTLTLNMSDGTSVNVTGISTGEGADGNDFVTSGAVIQNNGEIKLTYTNPAITNEPGHVITGLSEYIDLKTSGFVETEDDKHVTGGSVNQQGVIVVEQNGVTPNVELDGLSSYVDTRLVGKYLPLSGGTVSGNTTFTSNLVANGSNGITATKFVKDGGTNTQVLMADGSVKDLGTITGDNYVTGGSVDSQGIIHLANTDTSRNDTITGLSQYIGDMLDGNDYVVSGSVNTGTGVITLTNTDPTKNGKIVGLSDYVSSVTQNFITSDQDKYVESGSVNTNDGTISLKIKNQSNPVTIEGLADYVSTHQDGNDNDYVIGGAVNQSSGDIDLTYNTSRTGKITGLAQYVADHSSVGDWVDVSGDTMTGNLVMSGASISFTDGVDELIISSSNPENLSISSTSDDVHVTINGDVTATGAMYSSDKRLKENIESVSAEDLDNVKNIDFKTFNFVSNKTSQKIGVIAQELQDNGLGKLTGVNDAGYLTVDYISLLCLKIAELEKEIKELKSNKA